MPTWPGTLPTKPQKSGFSEKLPDPGIIRSTMDSGTTKVRRRATAGIGLITCTFELTTAQAATLETFWKTTLSHGTLVYTWDHPRTGATLTDKWRFLDMPIFTPRGEGYIAVVKLEYLP